MNKLLISILSFFFVENRRGCGVEAMCQERPKPPIGWDKRCPNCGAIFADWDCEYCGTSYVAKIT